MIELPPKGERVFADQFNLSSYNIQPHVPQQETNFLFTLTKQVIVTPKHSCWGDTGQNKTNVTLASQQLETLFSVFVDACEVTGPPKTPQILPISPSHTHTCTRARTNTLDQMEGMENRY
jgi:hypothetical protein